MNSGAERALKHWVRVEGAGSIGGECGQDANSAEERREEHDGHESVYLEGGLTLCEMGWKKRLKKKQDSRGMEARE